MTDLSVEELAQWQRSGKDFVLLDVREPFEVKLAALPRSLQVPMRQLPAHLHELDREADIVVLCHHGGRGQRVAQFLRMQGFARARNLDGGIDAYSKRVDASVPRY